MSTTTSHTTFDAGELRRVFAEQDGPGLLALFADDATVEIADSEHPPAAPLAPPGRDRPQRASPEPPARGPRQRRRPRMDRGHPLARHEARDRHGRGRPRL